jgi:FHA domain
MNRLVVNPGRPDAWEIQLKDGANRLGRGDAGDFKIPDASVSGSHCQIVVSGDSVSIQDLGSTNGTFINGAPVRESKLQNGQTIRLGGVEMMFHADAPQPAASPAAPRLRLSGMAHASAQSAPAPDAPPTLISTPDVQAVSSVCKFHPKNAARWLCNQCNRSFCELCVTSRTVGATVKKMCRACGVECAPLNVEISPPVERGFFLSLPDAIIYPFRGAGILILLFSAVLFSVAGNMAGLFSIVFQIIIIGYLFSYMQNIIHATANEEEKMPELPGMDDVFGGFLRLMGCILMSFGLVIALLIARFSGVDIPVSAILITLALGCLYFPMAFLAVAMKDNVMASNPLVVVPSILRVPFQYLATVVIFALIFGVQRMGDLLSGGAKSIMFTSLNVHLVLVAIGFRMIWSFISVYLLTVNMRILGLLYATQKGKLGW